jgi:hypothetical protein
MGWPITRLGMGGNSLAGPIGPLMYYLPSLQVLCADGLHWCIACRC